MVETSRNNFEGSEDKQQAKYTKASTKPGIGIDDITNAINRKIHLDHAGIKETQQNSLDHFASALKMPAESLFDFFEFEDGRIIRHGDMELVSVETLTNLPGNLTVKGNMLLMSLENLHQLPEGLIVEGNIVVVNTPLENLPTDIKAKILALPQKADSSLKQKAERLLQSGSIKELKFT
jgi:hypothetical protein